MNIVSEFLDDFVEFIRGDQGRKRSNFDAKLRNRLLRCQKGKCVYCGNMLKPHGKQFRIDHIVPVARGGGDEWSNLQALCRQCNGWKSDHTGDEFLERIDLGLQKLNRPRAKMSRKLIKDALEVTEWHDNVRKERTKKFRRRLARLAGFLALLVAAIWIAISSWQDYPVVIGWAFMVLAVLYTLMLLGMFWRANTDKKKYFRWNPGRKRV